VLRWEEYIGSQTRRVTKTAADWRGKLRETGAAS
jgi:hypothetical protein